MCCRGNRYLVVLTPGPGPGSVEAEEDEGILTADDEQDGDELQVGDQVTDTPEDRKELFLRICWLYWFNWFYFILIVPTLPTIVSSVSCFTSCYLRSELTC